LTNKPAVFIRKQSHKVDAQRGGDLLKLSVQNHWRVGGKWRRADEATIQFGHGVDQRKPGTPDLGGTINIWMWMCVHDPACAQLRNSLGITAPYRLIVVVAQNWQLPDWFISRSEQFSAPSSPGALRRVHKDETATSK
jgi:hypothetical protein